MKKSLLTLTMALSLGGASFQAVSVPARAAESSSQKSGRAALVAIYQKTDQAMVKKDVAAMTFHLAPDYQSFMRTGQVLNRAQSVAMVQQLVTGSASGVKLNYTKCSTRILSLTWRGKDAVIMAETTAVGKAGKGGRTARMEQVSVTRDYWTPTAQGWKIRQSAESKSSVWMNGQRVI
ncbi:hypothetical protein B1R32_107169 [Abditibacterium utsteinense]|uniref:SnoaL-like domain-containing protein n=1 Tax=Abditibacterium utsteinense TaxID=1960156 RepID=A0A2S8STK9_9BACT|nr:nuclear transport factor 2 family protein [Abditibacterium utsteinense]PQV64143.1 hypothetical protein B1R32_107169 [Abditibacterium utsteinense]